MFEYTEYSVEDKITKLELLKPNEQSLGEILNAKNKITTLTLGGVCQLTFDIPDTTLFSNVMLDKNEIDGQLLDINVNESSQNNQAKNALVKYLVRATYTNGKQIIFVLPSKNIRSDLSTVGLSVQCYSREYELASNIIINYIGVPINDEYTLDGLSLEEVLRDILQDTLWTIEFLDEDFNSSDANVIRRTVEAFNNISILAAIDNLMGVFGGIAEYDTINRKISIYKADNYEHYKFNGLEINDYNYLKEIDKQEQTDNLITRLYGLGKDGITINAISPTGTSYLEDLSFFLYPAEMNELEELIKSSNYMSDSLALAELKYEKYLETQTGQLNILFDEKGTLQNELTILLNELYHLQTSQKLKEDQVDLKVGLGEANLDDAEYVQILDELDAINLSVGKKETEISKKESEIQDVTDEINVIYDNLKIENHFTNDELKERQLYIYEGLYTNTGIGIETDLYDEMVEYLKRYNTPNVTINIGIKDIFSMQTKQARKDKNKIRLGEQVNIYYKKGILEVDIRAQIMEIKIDEEKDNMELIISNILDYKKNADDWISKILQRNITTSTIVETNRVNWNSGKIAYDDINQMYQEGIDAAKIEINSAVNNSVKTDNRGITVTDTTNPLRFVRVTNGVVALSKDGGRTFSTAISADGVWAERLIGQILIGNELEIIGDSGTLKIGDIPTSAYPDLATADFGIVVNSDNNRIFVTRERGFKITTPGGVVKLSLDANGNIIANDMTANNSTFSGTMTSNDGSIGGWTIDSSGIKAGTTNATSKGMLSGNTYAFYAGHLTASSAPFRVTQAGALVATNATIEGAITATSGSFTGSISSDSGNIGTWTINSTSIYKGSSSYGAAGSGNAYFGNSGISLSDKFKVDSSGNLTATDVNINGVITATSGSFTGSLYSSSGTIGGWSLSSSGFSSVTSFMQPDGDFQFTSGSAYISMGIASTHLWTSGINVNRTNGLNFMSGTGSSSVGRTLAYINSDSSGNCQFSADGNIQIKPSNIYYGLTVSLKGSNEVSLDSSNAVCLQNGIVKYTSGGGKAFYDSAGNGTDPTSTNDEIETVGGTSGRAWKKNIEKINLEEENKLIDFFANIPVSKFTYKYGRKKDEDKIGFILEDIKEIKNDMSKYFTIKNEVRYDNGINLNIEKTSDSDIKVNALYFDKEDIISLMVAGTSISHKKIKELENKIKELEEKVNEGK